MFSKYANLTSNRIHFVWMAGQQRPATIVGTASYQHTLHRVRTMSEKALALRIRAIERGEPPPFMTFLHLFLSILPRLTI
jgi:hypothetical protein